MSAVYDGPLDPSRWPDLIAVSVGQTPDPVTVDTLEFLLADQVRIGGPDTSETRAAVTMRFLRSLKGLESKAWILDALTRESENRFVGTAHDT